MPAIKGIPGPYRFFFYSFDCNEPMHVHIKRERKLCKYWLIPVQLATNDGFSAVELSRIRVLILKHRGRMEEAWNEHCGE
jgi:hypothetical protein